MQQLGFRAGAFIKARPPSHNNRYIAVQGGYSQWLDFKYDRCLINPKRLPEKWHAGCTKTPNDNLRNAKRHLSKTILQLNSSMLSMLSITFPSLLSLDRRSSFSCSTFSKRAVVIAIQAASGDSMPRFSDCVVSRY